jgi:hypothetical protein
VVQRRRREIWLGVTHFSPHQAAVAWGLTGDGSGSDVPGRRKKGVLGRRKPEGAPAASSGRRGAGQRRGAWEVSCGRVAAWVVAGCCLIY